MEEREILIRTKESDITTDELTKTYEKHRAKLVRYCQQFCYRSHILRTPHGELIKADAEDQVQEHFLGLFKQLLENGDYFRAIKRGLKNRAIDESRSKRAKAQAKETNFPTRSKKDKMVSSDPSEDDLEYTVKHEAPMDTRPVMLQDLIRGEKTEKYFKVIDSVTKKFTTQMYEIVALYLQDHDYEEIGQHLRIPTDTVRKEFHKAIDRFRYALRKLKMLP